ncbi:ATP synthase subunit g, mitochondrial-like [Hypanus sabinus]|uniref:ATP synthase subunit g, mitochondrial-like n=1 Tax=Hypanus sabinus TaxID=79690 RepID=UPI0028C41F52|nr:ATP synthase subunit g, mitochondrial-like [Hypanus sabinus]
MAQAVRWMVQRVVTGTPMLASAVVKYSRPRIATFWKYAWVELSSNITVAVESFKGLAASFKAGTYKQLTVKDALRNTKVLMWFFISEVIGRGSLIGHRV